MSTGLILYFAALLAMLWFLVLRPQQRRAKATRDLMSALQVGDEVLTAAGIYGQITEFDGPTVFLAVSDALEIKVTRESIAQRVSYDDPTETDAIAVGDDVEENS